MTHLLCPLALAFALSSGDPAQDTPDAAAILSEVDRATVGGFKGEGRRRVKMTGRITVPGMDVSGTCTETYDSWDRVKYVWMFAGMGTITRGTTGTHSWNTDPTMGITVRTGDEQMPVRRALALGARVPWKELYASAEVLRADTLDERAHWVLEMKPARGESEKWWVDQETHLVSVLETRVPDPNGGWLPVKYRYHDFKAVDGVPYARRRVDDYGPVSMTFTFEKIEHLEKLEEGDLAPPPAVMEAFGDPGKATPRADEGCKLRTVDERHVATIRMKVKATEVSKSLSVMLPAVHAYLTRRGIVPTGAPFSRYHSLEDGVLDLEAGIPVGEPFEGEDRVQCSTLPGGKVATTWHIGEYDKLGATHDRLRDWMKEQGYEARGGQWEVYWTDPGLEPNPAKWRTEVLWPIED